MKQKLYFFGLLTTLLIFLGSMFKVNHIAGANILLNIGIGTLVLIFLPLALRNSYKTEGNKENYKLYLVTWLTCFVVFSGMLFKIMHWPLAGYFLLISLPFPYIVFLPVFLSVTAKNKKSDVTSTVFVFFLLATVSVFSVFLALNVSRATIDESYNLSQNYSRLEKELKILTSYSPHSTLNSKIDTVLKVINEYRDLILKQEGLTTEAWKNYPGNLWRPDARQAAFEALKKGGESHPGDRLEKSMENLVEELKKSKGYEDIANSAPLIFDYTEHDEHPGKFENNTLSWLLIYLDGLETNLSIVKAMAGRSKG